MRGWKQDLQEHVGAADVAGSTYRSDRYGAARLSAPSSSYDLMRYCLVRDQEASSACVGFAVTGAVYCRLRSLGYDCGPFSALSTYTIGRQLEGTYKGKVLPDDGSYPFLVMSGAKRFGLVPEHAWPFDASYLDRVQQEVPFDVFQRSSQFRLSSFARIDAKGEARVKACVQAIASGHPVPLGMQVGREFESYGPGRDPIGVEADALGGHMTFLCGYEDDGEVFIGCNSWGRSWGDGGFYRIHKSKLMDSTTDDLYDLIVTDQRA